MISEPLGSGREKGKSPPRAGAVQAGLRATGRDGSGEGWPRSKQTSSGTPPGVEAAHERVQGLGTRWSKSRPAMGVPAGIHGHLRAAANSRAIRRITLTGSVSAVTRSRRGLSKSSGARRVAGPLEPDVRSGELLRIKALGDDHARDAGGESPLRAGRTAIHSSAERP
jgi:hypothetical protein